MTDAVSGGIHTTRGVAEQVELVKTEVIGQGREIVPHGHFVKAFGIPLNNGPAVTAHVNGYNPVVLRERASNARLTPVGCILCHPVIGEDRFSRTHILIVDLRVSALKICHRISSSMLGALLFCLPFRAFRVFRGQI